MVTESLRDLAETMVWGDQNEAPFWDYFLEKDMLRFFRQALNSFPQHHVKNQVIQSLSILIQNMRDPTAVIYLLSGNTINSIISHDFDFTDEETVAHYISFLRTLSLLLNDDTVGLFFNDRGGAGPSFPLYTYAIRFFNHGESMVRIAARTLSLNVFRLNNEHVRRFVLSHGAEFYDPPAGGALSILKRQRGAEDDDEDDEDDFDGFSTAESTEREQAIRVAKGKSRKKRQFFDQVIASIAAIAEAFGESFDRLCAKRRMLQETAAFFSTITSYSSQPGTLSPPPSGEAGTHFSVANVRMSTGHDEGRLDQLMSEIVDRLLYINDVLELNVEAYEKKIYEALIKRYVGKLLLHSLFYEEDGPEGNRWRPSHKIQLLSKPVTLLLLSHLFVHIQSSAVINGLTACLFSWASQAAMGKIPFKKGYQNVHRSDSQENGVEENDVEEEEEDESEDGSVFVLDKRQMDTASSSQSDAIYGGRIDFNAASVR